MPIHKTKQLKYPRKPRNFNLAWSRQYNTSESKPIERCLYCSGKDVVKRGFRKKKHETVQLYKCKKCERTFTAQVVKHKQYPLKTILDAISIYNLGYSEGETCKKIKEKYGAAVKQPTLSRWIKEYTPLCRYSRLRPEAIKYYSPNNIIQSTTLRHQQIYHYRYHQAKLDLLFEKYEFRNLRELKSQGGLFENREGSRISANFG